MSFRFDKYWIIDRYKEQQPNVLTPTILKWRVIESERAIVELSSGRGITNNPIWGVTVMVFDDDGDLTRHRDAKSKLFHDKRSADSYYLAVL